MLQFRAGFFEKETAAHFVRNTNGGICGAFHIYHVKSSREMTERSKPANLYCNAKHKISLGTGWNGWGKK
jgi:hypothetical protein